MVGHGLATPQLWIGHRHRCIHGLQEFKVMKLQVFSGEIKLTVAKDCTMGLNMAEVDLWLLM